MGTAVGGRRSEGSITWNCLDFCCNCKLVLRCDIKASMSLAQLSFVEIKYIKRNEESRVFLTDISVVVG